MFNIFSKYLLIGLSAMVLLAGAQNGLFNKQTLNTAEAQTANPQFPCETDATLCGANETFCEQTGDNLSEFIFKHEGVCHPENGEHDANGCIFIYTPQAPVYHNNTCSLDTQSAPPVAPSCPADTTIPHCVGQQMCTFNVHHRADCSTYEGGAYGCVDSSQCGFNPAPETVTCYLCDNGNWRQAGGGPYTSCPSGMSTDRTNPSCVAPSNPQPQTCYVCDNTGYADGQGRWRVSGGSCDQNLTCQANISGTFAGCVGATAGAICESRSNPACVSDGSCSVSTPSVCGQTAVGVDNCGSSCSRPSADCPVPAPAQGGDITVNPVITNTNNPTVTNTNTNTNTVTNNVTREVVREVAAPATFGNVGVAPAVVYTQPVQYTTLPKTGLPELAWSALAFIPTGFGLRRFAKVKKALENHPSYIFEDRQFKAES